MSFAPIKVVKTWLRDRFGFWPLMEFRNRLQYFWKERQLAAFERQEIARLRLVVGSPLEERVACVIPTCNRPQHLLSAVNSILSQSRQDFVIIIVDDGMGLPPGIPDDRRIRAVSLSKNSRTAGLVRNVGVALSKSDYIAFLDDDNTWTSTHLASTIEGLTTGADLVYSALRRRTADGREIDVLSQAFDRKKFANETAWVDASAIVMRRSAFSHFSRIPRTRDTLPKEDWELVWRLSRKSRVGHVAEVTVEYLVNEQSYFTNWSSNTAET